MSNVLRNDLWMVMIAWSLFLCGYRFVSLVVLCLVSVYLYRNVLLEDGFRAALVFSVNAVLDCFSLLVLGFSLGRFMMVMLVSFNCALLDIYLRNNEDEDLLGACIIGSLMFTVFLLSSFLVGIHFVLVTLMIFVPYLSTMLAKVFEKEQKIPFCSYNIKA